MATTRFVWNPRFDDLVKTSPAMRGLVSGVAQQVAGTARELAPRGKTGRLSASIEVETELRPEGWVGIVADTFFTAHLWEFGHIGRDHVFRIRPYLRPALRATGYKVEEF